MKQIYLFLLFCCIGFTASAVTEYKPSTTNTFSGGGTYCQSVTATPLTYVYNTCNSGGGAAAGVACNITWYYNTTNTTAITGGTTTVAGPISFACATAVTGSQSYTPSTTTAGTFYYFCVITWSGGSGGCGGPSGSLTSPTQLVTVNAGPAAITGPTGVCIGNNITLSDATPGGGWSSSNTAIATVGVISGVVTGVGSGTATITYTVISTGCFATYTITSGSSSPISGSSSVCVGSTTSLSASPSGGTWTSSAPSTASVDASGVVTGVATGTSVISYEALPGCFAMLTVSVTGAMTPITGPSSVCVTKTITLANATSGGVWSSGSGTVATVNPTTGVVTGIAPGATFITYTVGGCFSTAVISVAGNPAPILPSGPVEVCVGSTTLVSDLTSGGTWDSNPTTTATISGTGTITGIAAGVATITYTYSGCSVTKDVTVNPVPSPITGTTNVCMASTTTLASATTGGTWTSAAPTIATIGLTDGIVTGFTGGTTTVSYILSTGCYATATVAVGVMPGPIRSADSAICAGGDTVTYIDTVAGGAWSSSSGNATVSSAGLVTGVTAGTALISYTTPGCPSATKSVTIDALPSPISGAPKVCNGDSTTLYNTTAGGRWSSSNLSLATVDSITGKVYGLSMGTLTITYKMAAGCQVTTTLTVNPLAPITGDTAVCENAVTFVADIVGGGTWSSSNPLIASVDDTTGEVTGIVPGISYIVYMLPTGCTASFLMEILPALPSISGSLSICTGSSTTLANAQTGGVWSTNNAFVAAIGSATGTVNGLFPDTTSITYTMPHGCIATTIMTINPLPTPAITYNAAAHTLTTGSYSAYQWFDGATGPISGATNAVLTSVNGNHYYSVTVTDANGCMGSATWYGAVGVNTISAADIHVFPNPATTTVSIIAPVAVKAVISGMEGKVLAEQANATAIDISKLPNGLYMLSLYDDSGNKLATQKLIKE